MATKHSTRIENDSYSKCTRSSRDDGAISAGKCYIMLFYWEL